MNETMHWLRSGAQAVGWFILMAAIYLSPLWLAWIVGEAGIASP